MGYKTKFYWLAPLPMVLWNSCDMRGPRGPKRCGGSPLASNRAKRIQSTRFTGFRNKTKKTTHDITDEQCLNYIIYVDTLDTAVHLVFCGTSKYYIVHTLQPSHFRVIRLTFSWGGHAHRSCHWAWSCTNEHYRKILASVKVKCKYKT